MSELFTGPLWGIVLSILCFAAGTWLSRRFPSPLVNPLLIAIALAVAFLKLTGIPLNLYQEGGDVISLFLGPATASLALSIYNQIAMLRRHWLPITAGALVGSAVSIGSVLLLCRLFGLDQALTASLIPKSVTTPIAMEISRQGGGIIPLTVAMVVFTGILGAVFAPSLAKLLRIQDPISLGVAIGTSSHALGTSRAIQMGEIEGAMSGLSIGIAGLITVILSMFL